MNAIEQAKAALAEITSLSPDDSTTDWNVALKMCAAALAALPGDSQIPEREIKKLADRNRGGAFTSQGVDVIAFARAIESRALSAAPQPQEPAGHVVDFDRDRNEAIINVALEPGTPVYAVPVAAQPQDVLASALRQIAALPRYDLTPKDAIEIAEKALAAQPVQDKPQEVDDLAALVGRLVRALRKASPGNELAETALDYLKRKQLVSPLREPQGPKCAMCNGTKRVTSPNGTVYRCDCRDNIITSEPQEASAPAQAVEGPWQPIATAPKDGTRIIAWVEWRDGPAAEAGSFEGDDFYPDHRDYASELPTHWMPAPTSPVAASHPQAAQAQTGEQE